MCTGSISNPTTVLGRRLQLTRPRERRGRRRASGCTPRMRGTGRLRIRSRKGDTARSPDLQETQRFLSLAEPSRVAFALHGRESHKQCPRAGAMGMAGASHPSSAQLRLRTSPGHVSLLSPAALSQADGWAGTWAGGGARIAGYHLGACKSWQHRPGGRGSSRQKWGQDGGPRTEGATPHLLWALPSCAPTPSLRQVGAVGVLAKVR